MWTSAEKDLLIELYDTHTDRDLCSILNKTSGQVRGMKERLGLNRKSHPFTSEEKEIIENYYLCNPDEIDLNKLAAEMGRERTSISRYARSLGLTRTDRPPSSATVEKIKASQEIFRNSQEYIETIKPKCAEMLSYYAKNQHPRGMLGKHHTDEVRKRLSESHRDIWAHMSVDDRMDLVKKIRSGCIAKGVYVATSNTYSRCHGGYRDDLHQYFRSSWEANIARLFNHLGFSWEYEATRFKYDDLGDGVLSYCPDFYIPEIDSWVEVKGWMDEKSVLRLKKFREVYPEQYSKLLLVDEKVYSCISKDLSHVIPHWEIT